MGETRIECPSGLIVMARGLKGQEANLLADKRTARSGTLTSQILANCLRSVVDPGPYQVEGGKLSWDKVHVGDRLFSMLRIRAATYGEEYNFSVQCEGERCGQNISCSMALNSLPVKPLPEEAREALRRGDRMLTVKFMDRDVRFRLLVGEDEAAGRKLLRDHEGDVVTTALLHRVTAVSEVAPNDRGRWLADMDMPDLLALRDLFDSKDGGVDTDITVECANCGLRQEVSLPFGKEFFLPKRRAAAETTPTSG